MIQRSHCLPYLRAMSTVRLVISVKTLLGWPQPMMVEENTSKYGQAATISHRS